MNIQKGSIVRAKAGRDKEEGFFVVLRLEGGFAYIADGRRRRVQKPKKKNLLHLAPTNTVIKGSPETNNEIKRILNEFNSIEGNNGG